MRALFVAPYLPTPGSGGRTRLQNVMERLSREHELSLVAFRATDQQPDENPYPGAVLDPPAVRARPGGMAGRVQFWRERFDRLPAFVSWMRAPEMRAAIADALTRFRPDVVQFETTEMGQYLPVARGTVRTLDLQDVASRWFGRVSGQGDLRRQRVLMRLELAKTRAYERAHARMADVVYVSSEIERMFLGDLAGISAAEVPNGVDTVAFAPRPDVSEEETSILFVGPLSYAANLDAMRWFAREILPLIRVEEPRARVDLVGAPVPDADLGEHVTLHGRVEDVRPWLARAPVSVVPVRVGSGTRYKILEALSMERAVVSTSVGAEGLGVRDGEHLLIADDPQAFARAVIRLLREPGLGARLGAAGRAHVVPRYDWGPLVARISASWSDAVGRRASTR